MAHVENDIENLRFNVCIAHIRELANTLQAAMSEFDEAAAAARANIAAYAAMRSAAFPASATETLLAALAGLERNPEE